jgi:hypothetical protein
LHGRGCTTDNASAKPKRSRLPRPSNDNSRTAKAGPRYAFDVYRAAARARWIGRVVAHNADAAIEAAAVGFRTDVRKLIAVRRFEIAS